MIDAAAIIPTTGRRPALLRRALASVLAQSSNPREILVIVDGTEGQVPEVRAQLAGLDAMVHAVGAARGAGAARNHGARIARTSYLCFLDDDDVWKPGYLGAVFAEGPSFDLALTAFEKHNRAGVRPEKIPPEVLDADAFLVANPGLRGSNLVLTRALFWAAGGFSERLPSFNDMDFGLRLVAAQPRRYRRILAHLVEYHAHEGERLSSRGARAIPPGLTRFLQEHGPRMDHRQEAAFRARAIDLWGIDPWTPQALERRLAQAVEAGEVSAHFPGVLHAAETALLEATCRSDGEADEYQGLIDRLCKAFELRGNAPRVRSIRIAIITTDTPGSVAALLGSLERALTHSHWRARAEEPTVELLFIRNDSDAEVDEEHGETLRSWTDRRMSVTQVLVPARLRPLSLADARAFAFRAVRDRGWRPSPERPVWFLDEDFRFEVLAPSLERGFRRIPGGSLLHRIEYLALHHGPLGIDALVGGNSGAAPVPTLGILRRQISDLVSSSQRSREGRAQMLSALLRRHDPYYDLSRDSAGDLCVPMTAAWWRMSDQWTWDEVVDRLLLGLPVTRPALPSLPDTPPSAWGHLRPATIAGGNTVLLSQRVLRPEAFLQIRWRSIRSRRGDTVWCISSQHAGAQIRQASFPLLHDRTPRRGAAARDMVFRDALADALGVGLYETLAAQTSLAPPAIAQRANHRLSAIVESLRVAAALLDEQQHSLPAPARTRLANFLEEARTALAAVQFEGIELVGAEARHSAL